MKIPALDYAAPDSLDEALRLLAAAEGSARILAGGQSLMPMLAFRVVSPALLIDLRRIPGLDGIAIELSGPVRIGARARWCDLERSEPLRLAQPLLHAALPHIAHYQIRNRGTVGGSLAHADPAAELPALTVACGAEILAVSAAGQRVIGAGDFFLGPMTTALRPEEVIVKLHFPAWPPGRCYGFEEFSRRQGDFALAGAAVLYDRDGRGLMHEPRIVVFGVGNTPLRLLTAEAELDGRPPEEEAFAAAASAATAAVNPGSDIHAPADYRRSLLGTMVLRALQAAASRPTGSAA